MIQKRDLIQIGKIIKLSGHSGELIVSGPSLISDFKNFEIPIFIDLAGEIVPFFIDELKSINSEKAVIRLQYVVTQRKAESLIGKNIFIASTDEKKDEMKFDLIGYKVVDLIYGEVGELKFIDENSKNPLMIIENGNTEIYIPFRQEFIEGVDKKKNILLVKCPEGLLEIYFSNDEEE